MSRYYSVLVITVVVINGLHCNVALVSGKQISSTPLSHSNLIFTICHIKAQTHSNTVGINAPTGDFGQE